MHALLSRPLDALLATLALLALFIPTGADAQARGFANVAPTNVDVALVLAVDASQSMDKEEQTLQRDGYVGALTSEEVLTAISYGRHRRIAVAYFEWGSLDQQVLVAPWTIIDGPDAAKAFAARIGSAPLNNLQRTSISAAMTYAGELFTRSGVNATRKVVDISGDGPNNQGVVVSEARDALVSQGVTINGLPIVIKETNLDWNPIPQLDRYYEDCVIGGEGSFAIPVKGMANFGTALKMKLVLEIAGLTLDLPRVIPAAATTTNCRYYE
ncbi:DUF1194 domain-containing protein [Prosthecomicrobium sp. N25]|uniref:DUF1194 domain-containing protein n=1 Tax=Prosthecomicrobium sp. N25 TaxID=3129254 RepID=UPI003077CC74